MKMRNTIWVMAVVMALLVSASLASAAVVALPDTAQGSTLTANVSDQADVSASSAIAFAVSDVTGSTANATDATITVSAMVLVNGNALKVEIQAAAESFSGTTGDTWDAADISWTATTPWTNGTGVSGTLSNIAYEEVGHSTANADTTSTTALTFTLGPNAASATGIKAEAQTLSATWKFSSYTPG